MALHLKKMNAVHLYLTTCRYVLETDEEYMTVAELYGLLSYLRQALSCCVCSQLLRQPLGPKPNVCQHFVCKVCIGHKMKLKPSCSWCKDPSEFAESTQTSILVHCFKKLCEYLYSSRFFKSQSNGDIYGLLVLLVQEGMAFDENYSFSMEGKLSILPCLELLNSKKKPKEKTDSTSGHKAHKKKTPQQQRQQTQPTTSSSSLPVEKTSSFDTLFSNQTSSSSYDENIQSGSLTSNNEDETKLFSCPSSNSGQLNDTNIQQETCTSIQGVKRVYKSGPQTTEKRKRSLWNSRGELTCLEPGHCGDDDDDINNSTIELFSDDMDTHYSHDSTTTTPPSCKKSKKPV